MRKPVLALGLLAILAFWNSNPVVPALADSTWCGVVSPTPDGYLALRAGPGTQFQLLREIPQGTHIELATGECRTVDGRLQCDPSRRWGFVESIPTLQSSRNPAGPDGYVQGWVRLSFVTTAKCRY